jgi:hypothetical protein
MQRSRERCGARIQRDSIPRGDGARFPGADAARRTQCSSFPFSSRATTPTRRAPRLVARSRRRRRTAPVALRPDPNELQRLRHDVASSLGQAGVDREVRDAVVLATPEAAASTMMSPGDVFVEKRSGAPRLRFQRRL